MGLFFLIGNAYSGAVLVTLTSERVPAYLADCSGFLWGDCEGTWTLPDGTEETGYITGPHRSDEGETVRVQAGPLGAYSGGWATNWPRLIIGATVDVALLATVVIVLLVVVRGRAQLRRFDVDTATGQVVWRVDRQGVRDRRGTRLWFAHREKRVLTELRPPGGTAWYRLRREESGSVLPQARLSGNGAVVTVHVAHADGRPLGQVRSAAGTKLTVSIRGPDGAERARAVHSGGLGSSWEITGVDGTRLAYAVIGLGGRLVRFEAHTPEEARMLIAVFLLESDRLMTASTMSS
ncbi:hypothetical protein Pen01_70380 [Phytomonospora endophytica]|nr:hypothetical protein Pen01_70380 [Phytomonospora endophytica]